MNESVTRRDFVKTSALVSAAAVGAFAWPSASAFGASGRGMSRLKVGVIGCGGRGTGAAANMLEASPDVEIHALGDMFPDRMSGARGGLGGLATDQAARAKVPDERCFTGFDAYQKVLATGVDIVILATPPHFRPIHLAAAIEKGCHVFMEKPVAVDPAGVRSVIESAKKAQEKKLCIVTGTQRRHEKCYLEAMARFKDGAIGKIVSARCYWNQGGLWMNARKPEWSDMEWQLRNWLYFTWLSGDHITEQHVHNLDVMQWVMGANPVRCWGMGGRQVRTSPAYGHVFDHFGIEYEYPNGVTVQSYCRQIEGCTDRVEENIVGTEGSMITSSGRAAITGPKAWKFAGENPNPYVTEHRDLMAAITGGAYLNEGQRIAESTMVAIMGRMAAYTGKVVTWEQAMNSKLNLAPEKYELGPLSAGEVAVPGKTPLI